MPYPGWAERPARRGDCREDARPCPYVTCPYHLYLDVNPWTGKIHYNFPELEVWELGQTCALDVADGGGHTLEDVADMVNLTRERVRQIETAAIRKIRAAVESGRFNLGSEDEA